MSFSLTGSDTEANKSDADEDFEVVLDPGVTTRKSQGQGSSASPPASESARSNDGAGGAKRAIKGLLQDGKQEEEEAEDLSTSSTTSPLGTPPAGRKRKGNAADVGHVTMTPAQLQELMTGMMEQVLKNMPAAQQPVGCQATPALPTLPAAEWRVAEALGRA